MSPIGFLTGMEAEARLLERAARHVPSPAPIIACAHASPETARAAVEKMVEQGARALMSFGVAGGLDPILKPGDTILGSRVIHPDGRIFPVDTDWHRHLLAQVIDAGIAVKGGGIAGVDQPAASAEQKSEIATATGAMAADMESHIVAEAAFHHGLPLAVIRAVIDPAWRTLPGTAIAAMTAQTTGNQIIQTIRGLIKHPADLPGMLRLGWDMGKAMNGLRGVAGFGPSLFVLD